jgi:hypothetical protein
MRTQHNKGQANPAPTKYRQVWLALFTATLALAITLTLSCSNGDDDNDNDLFSGDEYYEYLKERVKYYDPDDGERCKNGVVEWVCEVPGGDAWYNPLKQSCNNEVDYTCEDGNCYRTNELGTIEACGRELYVSSPNSLERCQGGVVELKCKTADGDKWYNHKTHYCDGSYDYENGTEIRTVKPKERCGSKYYNPYSLEICKNGVVERSCGYADWYNPETHYCPSGSSDSGQSNQSNAKPIERCGSKNYYPDDYERCNNGVVERKCGSSSGDNAAWYNSITQSCDRGTGTVTNKLRCGS